MNWTEKKIKELEDAGRIKGYRVINTTKPESKIQLVNPYKSKALIWLELNLPYWAKEKGIEIEREYQFDEVRKWRFDFCFPGIKAAVEFEGGIYLKNSGHNTAKHYTKDTDKYNTAAVQGWKVIRVTARNYKTAIGQLNKLL